MAVTPISQIVREGYAHTLATFNRGGVLHIAWTVAAPSGSGSLLRWRKHDAAEGTEVTSVAAAGYTNIAVGIRADGHLLVVYDDSKAMLPSLWAAVFDVTTGARLAGPVAVGRGSTPTLARLDGAMNGRHTLTYTNREKGVVYVRETLDDGATWGDERAVLNGRVIGADAAACVPFGTKHLSVVQTGTDARRLRELGSLTRSRPVSAVIAHGLYPERLFAVESTQRASAFADTLRGNAVIEEDGSLFCTTRTRLGTDDGVGEVMQLDARGPAPVLLTSGNIPAGASPGAEFARLVPPGIGLGVIPLSPVPNLTLGEVTAAAVGGAFGQIATASGHVFAAAYREDVTDGGLVIMRISDRATAVVSPGMHFHGVAVHAGTIVTCRMIGAQNYLSVGKLGANPLAPEWLLADHALPARADALALLMVSPEDGYVYAALADRLCVYRIRGLDKPVRLVSVVPVITKGRVMQIVPVANGNLACAMGEGGIAVFGPGGEMLAQTLASGLHGDIWRPGKSYVVGDYVVPTESAPYRGEGRRFRCTTAGASGTYEPQWAPSGTVVDGAARWVDDGSTVAVVTTLTLDVSLKRIYAAAVLGGATGTRGRIYTFDARGLI